MTVMDVHARVHAEVDRRRDELVAFLSDLVRFPSVNRRPHGDELACQLWLADYYERNHFEVDRFRPDEIPGIETHPGWWPGSDFTVRPNVVATRRGVGSGRSLLLLAHVDVVPEGPHELWRHGPFTPVLEGDALVGRGAADDKAGIGAQTMALLCLESAGFRVAGDVVLASVVDEESAGANGTLATLLRGHMADAAIYTDGLDLEVHVANLGGLNFEIEVQLEPDAVGTTIDTVVTVMNDLYRKVTVFGEGRRTRIEHDSRYADGAWPAFALRTNLLQAGSHDGGNPGNLRLHGACYVAPGELLADVKRELEGCVAAFSGESAIPLTSAHVAWAGREMPPSEISADEPFVRLVAESTAEVLGGKARITGMPMSDLFQFLLFSPSPMPTVAMGPARWNTAGGVHQPNESVLIEEHLIPFVKILASVMIDWCGVEPITEMGVAQDA